MGSGVIFYADEDDWKHLFKLFDEGDKFIYTKMLTATGEPIIQFSSAFEMLAYLPTPEKPLMSGRFLVSEKSNELIPTKVHLSDGSGIRWSFDMDLNLDTISILFGGQVAENQILQSTITTNGWVSDKARVLFKLFKKFIIKNSTKVGSDYVMSSAMNKLRNGWRLTQTTEARPEYDLKLPQSLG